MTLPEAPVSGGAQSSPGARGVDRIAAGQRPQTVPASTHATTRSDGPSRDTRDAEDEAGASLDAAALVRSIALSRARDPRVAVPVGLGLLVLVRVLVRRRRRTEGRLSVEEFERLVELVERRSRQS